ncbi:MAG: hemolysin family protein [Bacteroidia bacterium]
MDDPFSVTLIFIIFCLILSAFFSGMEIAFVSSSPLKIELDKKQNKFSGVLLHRFLKKPSQFIGVMLLGNNIVLVLYGILMADFLTDLWLYKYNLSDIAETFIQTAISTIIVLLFGEFLPKAIFRINPNRSLSLLSLPVTIIYYLLLPISFFIIGFSEWFLRLFFRMKVIPSISTYGKVDIENYLKEHTDVVPKNGEEVENEIQIFKNALSFSQVKSRECMIPRNEIVALEINDGIDLLKEKFIETEHSKILIYRETIDNIIGYVHSYEMFKNPKQIKNVLLPINVIPETVTVDQVLKQLKAKNRSIAVVVDEFGGTSGILTIEDIIEEIFGEIEDEHDSEDLYEKQADGEFILSGRLEIEYLNEKYRLNLPEDEEYDTLAGLVLSKTQDIPQINQVIELEDYQLQVLEVSNTKIELVKIIRKDD